MIIMKNFFILALCLLSFSSVSLFAQNPGLSSEQRVSNMAKELSL